MNGRQKIIRALAAVWGFGSAVTAVAMLRADEPKPEPKPTIKMATPLGLATGSTTKVVLRGLLLDGASEIRAQNSPLTLKILAKGKANLPPNTDPKRLGDTQVEVEATAPAEMPAGEVKVILVTPAGEAEHTLLVVPKDGWVEKHEPNGGFRDAQPIRPGQVVLGTIDADRNVDVFRVELTAGQHLVAEVMAARHGSLLDGLLSLYDHRGRLVDTNDDAVGVDPRLDVRIASAGTYYLVLVDALDQGGPTHPYQLVVRGD